MYIKKNLLREILFIFLGVYILSIQYMLWYCHNVENVFDDSYVVLLDATVTPT